MRDDADAQHVRAGADRGSGRLTDAFHCKPCGIATGLVVVGDLIGSGEAQERGIVGAETPNLAASLQGVARQINKLSSRRAREPARQSLRF